MSTDDASDATDVKAPEPTQWPFTLTLSRPVTFGKESIEALEFRRGKMGDLKGLNVDAVPSVNDIMIVASRLCGKPLKVIESLEDEDGSVVVEIVLSFFSRCLGAGRKA